jgi:hypothetical protein
MPAVSENLLAGIPSGKYAKEGGRTIPIADCRSQIVDLKSEI